MDLHWTQKYNKAVFPNNLNFDSLVIFEEGEEDEDRAAVHETIVKVQQEQTSLH